MPKRRDRTRKPIKTLDFSTTRVTRSQTLAERQKQERQRLMEAKRQEEALRKRREEALLNKPVAPAGSRGDGNFHMAFVQMGQGDCCVMSTPLGRVVMVDCGSDSREEADATFVERVRSLLYKKKFLRSSNQIDVVLLTHPDTDHYNHFRQVLGGSVQFLAVYHSGLRHSYSEGQTSNWFIGRTGQEQYIRMVEHHMNDGDATTIALNGTPVKAATATETVNRLDGAGGIRVLDEDNCKISILAAGVNIDYKGDNSNFTNRGSLVILIEVFGEKILLHGDATRSTEHYVLRKHKARIDAVTLTTAGHHGSNRTSSMPAYVNQVKPKLVVISAGKQVRKDHLPSEEVIDRYIDALGRATKIPSHEIFYWAAGGSGSFYSTSSFTELPVHITGSWTTFYYSVMKPK